MQYRREIDGLRAVAIVPVVMFHAGVELFSGGFVGVDVFFVISGYLIATILAAELREKRFSYASFVERRVRRIAPALFLVLLACVPLAFLTLLPADMKSFSLSVASVPLMSSNVFFWRTTGYFDGAAELKPLLHTWSLSVEEQFYLLFPFLLSLLWIRGRRHVMVVLSLTGLLSLTLAQWGALSNPSPAFFLLPTRAWELIAGAIAAIYASERATPLSDSPLSQGGASVGLCLIVAAIFLFNAETPFPGGWAVVPVAGTVLVLLFGSEKGTLGRLLCNRAAVNVGLMSYSAYLWHQPIMAFTRNVSGSLDLNWGLIVFSILATFLLAYATARWVERPFRERARFSRYQVLCWAGAASLVFVVLGLWGWFSEGVPSRFSPRQLAVLKYENYDYATPYRLGECFLTERDNGHVFSSACVGGGRSVIWGDSHAAALAAGFFRRDVRVGQFSANGCPPFVGVTLKARPNCSSVNNYVLAIIKEKKPNLVILHANWAMYRSVATGSALKRTIELISKFSPETKVLVLGGVPQWWPTLPAVLARRGAHSVLTRIENDFFNHSRNIENELASASSTRYATFVSAEEILCHDGRCAAAVLRDGVLVPTAWDYGHLTQDGAEILAKELDHRLLGI